MPHDMIAVAASGFGVAIFCYAGFVLGRDIWKQYQQSYVDGAATTLDSMYINMPPQNIFYLGLLSAILMFTLVSVLSGNFLVGVPFLLIGLLVPKIILIILKKKRDELFVIQLVDALMNMSNSLRAGFSLPQSLELIHKEMPNPISQEIRLVCQELRLGVEIEEALGNLYKRMPSPDLDLVVTAISIVRDVGGNLTEIFDNIANLIRERQRIEGKIRTLTAQGKLQAIVMCMLPVLVSTGVYFVAPDLFALLFGTIPGAIAIALVLLMMGVAVFIISKIIKIEV